MMVAVIRQFRSLMVLVAVGFAVVACGFTGVAMGSAMAAGADEPPAAAAGSGAGAGAGVGSAVSAADTLERDLKAIVEVLATADPKLIAAKALYAKTMAQLEAMHLDHTLKEIAKAAKTAFVDNVLMHEALVRFESYPDLMMVIEIDRTDGIWKIARFVSPADLKSGRSKGLGADQPAAGSTDQ